MNINYITHMNFKSSMSAILFVVVLLLVSNNTFADVPLKFDDTGNFISPDMILQARGLKNYDDGHNNIAIRNFKKSAQFGNERSKYLLALLYFQKKEWARGYAWLKLLNKSIENRDTLLKKIESLVTTDELVESKNILRKLESSYNDMTSLRRRHKWEMSIKGTGTHIQGLKALTLSSATIEFGNGIPITPERIKREVYEEYVLEYKPRGKVIMGVIGTIDAE